MGEGSRSAGNARFDALLRAAADLTGEHDLDQLLRRIVRCAAEVAGARYAAIGLYDQTGRIERFIHFGVDESTVARIGRLPEGRGLLGEVIVADGPIRLADLSADPRSCGFPPHHPPMRTFLGVPVRLGSRRFGNLYLTERHDGGGFDVDDERLVTVLAAFAAAAVEGALRVAAEGERAAARSELVASEERSRAQGEILARVIAAQEAERARVARDLHDQIGQALTSVLLGLRLVSDTLQREPVRVADALVRTDEVRTLTADALADVRQLAFELRPTVLDDVGLVPALRRLTRDMATRHVVAVEVAVDGLEDDTRFPAEVETVVYRVVQEALTNVVRHAKAARATVSLSRGSSRIRATVVDDGIGFEMPNEAPRSLGLAGMTERAALVGGTLEIRSVPAGGTTVMLEVPLG